MKEDEKVPENAPETLPRSTSLCAALVPRDIPPTPRVSDCSGRFILNYH
jgi:hypothetical protein